jgi:AcrR family transcriptional regulator
MSDHQTTTTEARVEATRQRILDAAVRCMRRWGIDKTNLNDIAAEAGVTRPTLYAHFGNREAIFHEAMLQSAYRFGQALVEHVQPFATPRERVLEACLYCLEHLPSEPQLALVSDQRAAAIVNEQALSTTEGRDICRSLFAVLLAGRDDLLDDVDEIAELSVRLLLSLLTMRGPRQRDAEQLRGFLQRRLLPGIGL